MGRNNTVLEKKSLRYISLNNIGLTSLENFPELEETQIVSFIEF